MQGVIGFSTSKSWVSNTIRVFRKQFMKDAPSHTFILGGHLAGEPMLIEATNPKIRIAPLLKYYRPEKKFELWQLNNYTQESKLSAIYSILDFIGEDYGYAQLLGYSWLNVGVKNPIHQGIVCSELVWYALKEMGYRDNDLMTMDPNSVAPDDILKSFLNNSDCQKIAEKDFDEVELTWL